MKVLFKNHFTENHGAVETKTYQQNCCREKCKVLKDLEKGMPNKHVVKKYSVLSNVVSTWVKNKEKLFI